MKKIIFFLYLSFYFNAFSQEVTNDCKCNLRDNGFTILNNKLLDTVYLDVWVRIELEKKVNENFDSLALKYGYTKNNNLGDLVKIITKNKNEDVKDESALFFYETIKYCLSQFNTFIFEKNKNQIIRLKLKGQKFSSYRAAVEIHPVK